MSATASLRNASVRKTCELPSTTAGGSLVVAVASANRDETVFRAPHRFDVHREVRPHLGFGVGPRHCPAYPTVIALATQIPRQMRYRPLIPSSRP